MVAEAPKLCGEVSLPRRNTKLKNETFPIVSRRYNNTAEVLRVVERTTEKRKKQTFKIALKKVNKTVFLFCCAGCTDWQCLLD